MEELIYVYKVKDSLNIYESFGIELFILGVFIFVYVILNQMNIDKRNKKYIKILFFFLLSFIMFSSLSDFFLEKNLQQKYKKFLDNSSQNYFIEGTVKDYYYNPAQKKEFFTLKEKYFIRRDVSHSLKKSYPKLINKNRLKLKIEYVSRSSKFDVQVLRIWRLY